MFRNGLLTAAAAAALGLTAGSADASLFSFATFNGNVKNSNDGASSNDSVISASTEANSTVLAAYLYTATYFDNAATPPATVSLDGNAITYSNTSAQSPSPASLVSYRADVTSIVASKIDGGAGGQVDFGYDEGGEAGRIDGSALVVVYENASLPEATVAILDGFSNSNGDQFVVNLAEPINTSDPDFFAEMALGISFSSGAGQFSEVEVNGQLLSEQAGDYDDGFNANGGLITVGGFDDALVSSPPATKADDTERYDLTSFLNDGDTQIVVDTLNPSNDDNIFLATFYVDGLATVINPEDPNNNAVIPLPLSSVLLLSGLMGFAGLRRVRKD